MALRTILLALDGSAESRYAAEVAWMIGANTGASVQAQHVVNANLLWKLMLHHKAGFIGSGPYFEAYEPMVQRLQTLGENLLDAYSAFVPKGLNSFTLLSKGSVSDEILKQLENSDMLVIGHRHNGDSHDSEQSLVCQIVPQTRKPVLLVQDQAKPWSTARFILGNADFTSSFVGEFMTCMRALSLTSEVYCLANANDSMVDEITRKMQDFAAQRNESVVVHKAFQQADLENYGTLRDHETLIVIPNLQVVDGKPMAKEEELTELLQRYEGSSLLFWPVELVAHLQPKEKPVAAKS
jgi:nucleotide-binding universal stress UspA family protein